MNPILTIKDLVYAWPGAKPIINGLSLEVEPGQALWIKGPSGCGKSTFLRLINGLVSHQKGSIIFAGKNAADWQPSLLRSRAALLPQTPLAFPGSVSENILPVFSLRSLKGRKKPEPEAMRAALNGLGLDDVSLSSPARGLSVGQLQRLALARLFLIKPDLVLLDEPVAPLDDESKELVEHGVADFAAGGGAVIMISHRKPHPEGFMSFVMQGGGLEAAG